MNNQFLAWYENLGFSGSSQSALLFPSFSDHFPTIFYSSFLLRELKKVLIFFEALPPSFAAEKYTNSHDERNRDEGNLPNLSHTLGGFAQQSDICITGRA